MIILWRLADKLLIFSEVHKSRWTTLVEMKTFFLYTLFISHTNKCNADTPMVVFVEKYWLMLSRGRICLKYLCSA